MRVDAEIGDYGYDVFLDGLKLQFCKRADDVKGTAVCYKLDENGEILVNGEETQEVRYKGNITIKKIEDLT